MDILDTTAQSGVFHSNQCLCCSHIANRATMLVATAQTKSILVKQFLHSKASPSGRNGKWVCMSSNLAMCGFKAWR